MPDIHRFEATGEAFVFARNKARYGHRLWIAWIEPDGRQSAARASAESLEAAIREAAPRGQHDAPSVWFYTPGPGVQHATFYGRAISVVLDNLKRGHITN